MRAALCCWPQPCWRRAPRRPRPRRPIPSTEVAEIIRQAYDTPPEIVAMAREALGNQPAE
jgi:hypothetical protein